MYNEINGDLIKLAKQGMFDVIAHGCNCFCTMKSGIAVGMAREFNCNGYNLESWNRRGDINKLGQIESMSYPISLNPRRSIAVVNAYTQYHANPISKPLDYEALTLCMRKMNVVFSGQKIGLPKIGAGLAGGDWERIKQIIQTELTDCDVTVVIYE